MSRLGKKGIIIPEKVEVKIDGNEISVKGPLGEIKRDFKMEWVNVVVEDGSIKVSPKKEVKTSLVLWGTYSSLLRSMVEGVVNGFKKTLLLEGVGFKVNLEGSTLVLNLGLSHPVKMEIPEGLKVEVEKNKITVFGVNKEQVGQFSAVVRSKKKPEPYKGKGIRYEDEVVRRKAGKKAVSAG